MANELLTRAIIVAPSKFGSSKLVQHTILDIYRRCFKRAYISSPSIHTDSVWKPVQVYYTRTLQQHETASEHGYFWYM